LGLQPYLVSLLPRGRLDTCKKAHTSALLGSFCQGSKVGYVCKSPCAIAISRYRCLACLPACLGYKCIFSPLFLLPCPVYMHTKLSRLACACNTSIPPRSPGYGNPSDGEMYKKKCRFAFGPARGKPRGRWTRGGVYSSRLAGGGTATRVALDLVSFSPCGPCCLLLN
jgi:hypothetical protein